MKLLVDIGNTRIKYGAEQNGVLEKGIAIIHQHNDYLPQIQSAWMNLAAPNTLAISCVSNKHIVRQLISLAETLWPGITVIQAQSCARNGGLSNAYQQANTLGIDRWLGLIALHHYYPGNSCVIDCGTAITIDMINKQGQHLGGLICPGLELMKQSLAVGTARLSNNHQHYPVGLANATEPAIYSGTLFAAAGLIEKSIADFCLCQTIVLTGGDASVISQYLNIDCIIDSDFILKGLSLYSKEGDGK